MMMVRVLGVGFLQPQGIIMYALFLWSSLERIFFMYFVVCVGIAEQIARLHHERSCNVLVGVPGAPERGLPILSAGHECDC